MADALTKDQILTLATQLATLDYYQVLKLTDRKAPGPEIKKAFFRESQALHPDKFYASQDQQLKDAVMMIYKRVAEAYAVLRDPDLRPKYDRQIDSGAAKRLERREAAPGGANVPTADPKAKNPQAQKYLQMGLMAMRKCDFAGAEMNLLFALKFEPGNDGIAKKLKEAQEKKNTAAAGKDPHKIL